LSRRFSLIYERGRFREASKAVAEGGNTLASDSPMGYDKPVGESDGSSKTVSFMAECYINHWEVTP